MMMMMMDDEGDADDEEADDMDDGRFCIPRRRNIAPNTCRTMLAKLGILFSNIKKAAPASPACKASAQTPAA